MRTNLYAITKTALLNEPHNNSIKFIMKELIFDVVVEVEIVVGDVNVVVIVVAVVIGGLFNLNIFLIDKLALYLSRKSSIDLY